MAAFDDYDDALGGNETAQLRVVVRTLAVHMMCLLAFKTVPDGLRDATRGLAQASLDLLDTPSADQGGQGA